MTVQFDQAIEPVNITADNFRAQVAPSDRWSNSAHVHAGGNVVGPMPVTLTSPGLVTPGLVFRNTPADEIQNTSTGSTAAFSGFPLNIVP